MNQLGLSFNHKQGGFSIVELMIAGLLGLVLIAGVIQLFLGSNRNYIMQEQLATIQEDGRFALMFLEEQVEMAGWDGSKTNSGVPVFAIDENVSADSVSDTLTISSKRVINGTDNRDCNGNEVANGLVTNTFFVEENELKCRGSGGNTQPLISGVDSFQILYGVETDLVCPDGVVDRYMTLTELNNSNLSRNILSVRMGILLASNGNVFPTAQTEDFQVLDQSSQFTDQILRRLFQQTVFMPNAAFKLLTNSDAAVNCMSNF